MTIVDPNVIRSTEIKRKNNCTFSINVQRVNV